MDRCAVFVDAGYLPRNERQVHRARLIASRRPARVASVRAMCGFGPPRPMVHPSPGPALCRPRLQPGSE